jgi:hypothetical protein
VQLKTARLFLSQTKNRQNRITHNQISIIQINPTNLEKSTIRQTLRLNRKIINTIQKIQFIVVYINLFKILYIINLFKLLSHF